MKWKEGVIVIQDTQQKEAEYRLALKEKQKTVLPQHRYLLEAIQEGTDDDWELIAYIMKTEHMNEVFSCFELAGFLVEYAEFIAEDTSHYDIVG